MIDSAEPTITCPADETVTCLADVAANEAGATSTGSCGDNGSIAASAPVGGAGNSACGELDGDTYTITYTVTDACGRIATCDQLFTIDSDEPTVTCPSDATVKCLAEVIADEAGASSTGSCGDGGSVTAVFLVCARPRRQAQQQPSQPAELATFFKRDTSLRESSLLARLTIGLDRLSIYSS